MCGINGIFAYHYAANPIDEVELNRTRDHMAKRGPDGAGSFVASESRLGFGHRRLAIVDLTEAGAQPMASHDGRLIVTFNGEIYNYPELRAELLAKGTVFQSHSDTEVLLHLYSELGPAMVSRLRGMFAFAIWDDLKRELFLARDPYGIKPLYYANDGWTLRFASQVKALIAGGAVSSEPEAAGVVGFHLWGHVPEPFTLFRDIRALPAGHHMLIDRLGPREPVSYFSIGGALAAARNSGLDERERAQLIQASVRDSVSHHLLADVEVGVFLSAGVDSGALLGLMKDAGVSDCSAITLSFSEFKGSEEDEAPLAARVAALYGARHSVRVVGEAEFAGDLPAIFDAMDQPSIDGVNTWFVAKAAAEAGLKVALSGLGGDELLAGYPSFTDLSRWRRNYSLAAKIPGAGMMTRAALRRLAPALASDRPKSLYMLDYAGHWAGAYLLRRGLFMPGELSAILDEGVLREGLRRLQPLRQLDRTLAPDAGSDVGRVCALESSHYMRNQLLRDADWAGMAHSVEIRTPLVDSVLLQQCAPAIAALQPGEGKRILAGAPSIPLPSEIATRDKTGFNVPTESWMSAAALKSGKPASSAKGMKGLASRDWARMVLSTATSDARLESAV